MLDEMKWNLKRAISHFFGEQIPKDNRIRCNFECRYILNKWFSRWNYTNDQIVEVFEYGGIKAPFGLKKRPNSKKLLVTSADGTSKYVYLEYGFKFDDTIVFVDKAENYISYQLNPAERNAH